MSEIAQAKPSPESIAELRVIPHYERLDEVLAILLSARQSRDFPYDLESAQLPHDEHNMPPSLPRGGIEHANFLWTVCYYMRGGIKSATAVRSLSKVYEQCPDLFQPAHAQHADSSEVYELLRDNGLSFSATTISKHWVENAQRMQERYGGDPRNIFDGVDDYRELCARIQNKGKGTGFFGFQEKMVSMIAYYLMDSELVEYFDFPLPVDMHVLRVSAATEIITFENVPENGDIYSPQTLATLRHMYHDYSVRHGISQLDVCNAVWSLSSAICGMQPGNVMLEPHRKDGRQGRSTIIEPLTIDVHDPQQQAMYNRSCGQCPIGPHCKHNMPSKSYYVQGIARLSERVRFDDDSTLFSLNALKRQGKLGYTTTHGKDET